MSSDEDVKSEVAVGLCSKLLTLITIEEVVFRRALPVLTSDSRLSVSRLMT